MSKERKFAECGCAYEGARAVRECKNARDLRRRFMLALRGEFPPSLIVTISEAFYGHHNHWRALRRSQN